MREVQETKVNLGLVGTVAILVGLVPAFGGRVGAVQIDQTEIELTIDPNGGSMSAQVRLSVSENAGNQQLVCYFLKPGDGTVRTKFGCPERPVGHWESLRAERLSPG